MVEIYEEFGSFEVDCFASASNSKGSSFFSRLDVPGSSGVNFFHQKLDAAVSHFCFPPPKLVVNAILHL